MNTLRVAIASCWYLLVLSPAAFSQPGVPARELSASVAAAQQPYARALTPHPKLVNGPEYVDYAKRYAVRTGHPFFEWPEVQAGSVYYNEHLFSGVRLAYDTVLDQLVLMPPNSPLTLRLLSEQVQSFTIQGHRFIRLVADSASAKVIHTGFYEVLLDSSAVQVLAKRTKRLQEHINQRVVEAEFSEADKVVLKKDGRYYAIGSRASVVRPFADRAKEMQQFLQAHKLRFNRTQREASAVRLAAYYSGLPPR